MSRTCFVMYDRGQKIQNVGKDGYGGQRRLFGGMGGKEEACGAI